MKSMKDMNKKELINELNEIIKKLIEQGKLKYYPFTRSISNWNVQLLRDGISLYGDKLKKEVKA